MGRFQVIKPHTILGTDQVVGIEVLTSMKFREATGSFAAEISENGKERKLSAKERDAENERAKVSFCEVLARQVKELDTGNLVFKNCDDVRAQLSDDQITDAYRQTMRTAKQEEAASAAADFPDGGGDAGSVEPGSNSAAVREDAIGDREPSAG